MSRNLALIGNPNCGKTTLFNLLTGSNQYVGNWAGVTVEKKAGKLKNTDYNIIDLLYAIKNNLWTVIEYRNATMNDLKYQKIFC